MKYSTIILLVFLAACHPGRKLYNTYNIEDSQGSINDISTEVIELQSQGMLKGQIVEESSQEIIVGATIILHNKKAMLGTVSDNNGRFQISNLPDYSYRLVVSLVGYYSFIDTISISAKECKTLTVELIETPLEFDSNY